MGGAITELCAWALHACAQDRTERDSASPSALNGIGMSGTIPASIGGLTALTLLCVRCRDDALPHCLRTTLTASPLPVN